MRIVALLAGLLTVGCGLPTAPDPFPHTYDLSTIDGSGPPWGSSLAFGDEEVDGRNAYVETTTAFVGGWLQLLDTATCQMALGYQTTDSAYDVVTQNLLRATVTYYDRVYDCSFHAHGSNIQVTAADSVYRGSIEGWGITLLIDGESWQYERRWRAL